MNQNEIDLQIAEARIDHDISALNTDLLDTKRKLLEVSKVRMTHEARVSELESKILSKMQEKDSLRRG